MIARWRPWIPIGHRNGVGFVAVPANAVIASGADPSILVASSTAHIVDDIGRRGQPRNEAELWHATRVVLSDVGSRTVTIETARITPEQRQRILALSEGHFLDLKAKEIAPGKLTKTICAFANADGGEVYVGIGENRTTVPPTRRWDGFATEEAANGHLQAFEALFPLGQDFTYTFLASDGEPGLVLQVLILKTRDVKKASDALPYVRRGAQSLPIDTPEKLRRLELDKGIVSFESEPVDAPNRFVSRSSVAVKRAVLVLPGRSPQFLNVI